MTFDVESYLHTFFNLPYLKNSILDIDMSALVNASSAVL